MEDVVSSHSAALRPVIVGGSLDWTADNHLTRLSSSWIWCTDAYCILISSPKLRWLIIYHLLVCWFFHQFIYFRKKPHVMPLTHRQSEGQTSHSEIKVRQPCVTLSVTTSSSRALTWGRPTRCPWTFRDAKTEQLTRAAHYYYTHALCVWSSSFPITKPLIWS